MKAEKAGKKARKLIFKSKTIPTIKKIEKIKRAVPTSILPAGKGRNLVLSIILSSSLSKIWFKEALAPAKKKIPKNKRTDFKEKISPPERTYPHRADKALAKIIRNFISKKISLITTIELFILNNL
jgi:hypothetical protein